MSPGGTECDTFQVLVQVLVLGHVLVQVLVQVCVLECVLRIKSFTFIIFVFVWFLCHAHSLHVNHCHV